MDNLAMLVMARFIDSLLRCKHIFVKELCYPSSVAVASVLFNFELKQKHSSHIFISYTICISLYSPNISQIHNVLRNSFSESW